ncbi:MAG: cell division protein ZapA [Rhodothermales bacterium]|nr:cell division protein ZapA [Rhodothermales bacterium]
MPQQPIRVHILGHDYPLRVEEQDVPFMERVARYVDGRMVALREEAAGQPDLTVAVLSALALGEELFAAREALEAAESDADTLVARLDRALGGAPGGAPDEADDEGAAPSTKPKEA